MYAKALGWLRRIFNAKLEKALKEDNSSLFFFFYFLFIQWFLSNEKATIESTRLRQPSGQKKKKRIQNTQYVIPVPPFYFL